MRQSKGWQKYLPHPWLQHHVLSERTRFSETTFVSYFRLLDAIYPVYADITEEHECLCQERRMQQPDSSGRISVFV